MKTRLNLTKIVLVLLALFGSLHTASAFYDPGVQRWLNRDPLAAQTPQDHRLWGNKLQIEVEQAANLYWPFGNEPISHKDPDGKLLGPVIIIIVVGIVVSGCSKAPPPQPGDPYGCWGAGNPHGLPKGGPAKPVNCLDIRTGCFQCCDDKFPINGGNPDDWAACTVTCEANYTWCVAPSTSKAR